MSSATCDPGGFTTVDPWIEQGGFILVILGIIALFWAFAFICEEYCIPAITILCKRHNISDDVAGAIFIGAGLSSPPVFVAFIGLFLSNASIGAGTVVGGDIFNHLLNMSASIVVSPRKKLQLDAMGLTREVIFYLASLILIIWAIKDDIYTAIKESFDSNTWSHCLSVEWYHSFILVCCYGVYTLNVIYLPIIIKRCCPSLAAVDAVTVRNETGYENTSSRDIEDVRLEDNYEDPFARPDNEGYIRLNPDYLPTTIPPDSIITGIQMLHTGPDATPSPSLSAISSPPSAAAAAASAVSLPINQIDLSNPTANRKQIIISHQKYVRRDGKDIYLSNVDNDFPLYKKSEFFTRYDFGCVPRSRQWKLRYFTANGYGLYYRLSETQPKHGSHIRFINMFQAESVEVLDHELYEFQITMRGRKSRRLQFQAVDLESFEKLILFANKFVASMQTKSNEERQALAAAAILAVSGGTGIVSSPDAESVDEQLFLVPPSMHGRLLYYITLPLRYIMHWTIPDVRKLQHSKKSLQSIALCVIWIFLFSYILVLCLNVLANLLSINGAIMGYTIGAWAASYPALWSSVVLARHDFGDMASCNALGSNTFTNFIGLGLPWLIYSIVNGGQPYVFRDDGVVLSILSLLVILIFYYLLIAFSKWTLHLW